MDEPYVTSSVTCIMKMLPDSIHHMATSYKVRNKPDLKPCQQPAWARSTFVQQDAYMPCVYYNCNHQVPSSHIQTSSIHPHPSLMITVTSRESDTQLHSSDL